MSLQIVVCRFCALFMQSIKRSLSAWTDELRVPDPIAQSVQVRQKINGAVFGKSIRKFSYIFLGQFREVVAEKTCGFSEIIHI
ncbi:hypothetical protein D3877_00425 [Azospirillum cavernae]|uniref:Uncharacterized protein n=1 Tax=Azospirillum cavernae TaxID=2320860 RepID=A0A418VZR4_9PROT|nr:hypothetical protein D3877_00425 [Azospirillum cavernae]